jgi:hypothetical protein
VRNVYVKQSFFVGIMSKTRFFGSPRLNVGYVTQSNEDLLLVERLLQNKNAVALASLDDAFNGVWRSYQAGAAVSAMPVKEIGLLDVLVFDWSINDDNGALSAARKVANRYVSTQSVYLPRLVQELSVHSRATSNLVTAIEDLVYSPSRGLGFR